MNGSGFYINLASALCLLANCFGTVSRTRQEDPIAFATTGVVGFLQVLDTLLTRVGCI
jgi:hypothetical protein